MNEELKNRVDELKKPERIKQMVFLSLLMAFLLFAAIMSPVPEDISTVPPTEESTSWTGSNG